MKFLESIMPKKVGRPKVKWTINEECKMAIVARRIYNGQFSKRVFLDTVKQYRDNGGNLDGVPEDKSLWAIDEKLKEILERLKEHDDAKEPLKRIMDQLKKNSEI